MVGRQDVKLFGGGTQDSTGSLGSSLTVTRGGTDGSRQVQVVGRLCIERLSGPRIGSLQALIRNLFIVIVEPDRILDRNVVQIHVERTAHRVADQEAGGGQRLPLPPVLGTHVPVQPGVHVTEV